MRLGAEVHHLLRLSAVQSPDVPHSPVCRQHVLTHVNKDLSLLFAAQTCHHLLKFVVFEENKSINKLNTFLLPWRCFRAPLPEVLSPYLASSFPLKFLYLLSGLEGETTPFLFSKTICRLTVSCAVYVHLFLVFWVLFVFWHCYSEGELPLGLISHLMVLISDILRGNVHLHLHVSQMVLKAAWLKEGKKSEYHYNFWSWTLWYFVTLTCGLCNSSSYF